MSKLKLHALFATIAVAIIALVFVLVNSNIPQTASATPTDCGSNTCLTSLYVNPGTFAVGNGGVFISGTSTLATTTQGVTTNTGAQLATTTNGNETLGANDLLSYASIISTSTFTTSALTITLPASSTLSALVPSAGNSRTIHFVNATTTALNITFAGNTGTILQTASTTKIVRSGGGSVDLTFYRPGTTSDAIGDIYVTATNFGF